MSKMLLWSLLLLSPSLPAEEALLEALPPAEVATRLATAEAIGKSAFVHDRAASVAMDALLEVRAFKKDRRVAGWVTQETDGLITVTFVGPREEGSKKALYRAVVSTGGLVVGEPVALDTPLELSEYESGAFAARSTALASGFAPCTPSYNSVVLPAAVGWRVYLLPATTAHDVVPLGGTYRLDIAADGVRVLDQRGFTLTCIQLRTGPRVEGLMITHLLDPVPTEAHVFWSLWAAKPMYVSTSGGLWSIESGKVRAVEREPPEG